MEEKSIPKKPIGEWLKIYKSEKTREGYESSVRRFLEYTYGKKLTEKITGLSPKKKSAPSEKVRKRFEELARRYLNEDRDYYRDVRDFIIYLRDEEEYAPNTQNSYLTGIKQFFLEYEVGIGRMKWKKLQKMTERNRPLTKDKRPTKEELKKILTHLPLRGRAFVYTLASSGMRVGELMNVTEGNVYFEENPTRIHLKAEWCKNRYGRDVFISREASNELKKWIEFKEGKWVRKGIHKDKQKEVRESDKLFPFTRGWATNMFNRALKKAGLSDRDGNTKKRFHKIHLHTLRKFFKTKMSAEIPRQTVEALLGHRSNLEGAYRRLTLDEMREDYLDGEPAVTIHETKTTLKREVEESKSKIERLKERLDKRNGEIERLKERLEEYEERLRVKNLPESGDVAMFKEKEIGGEGEKSMVYELMKIVKKQSKRLEELEEKIED